MKWGLQHVKVTLEESESGETVVIEQSSDGRVTCERGKPRKGERAANTPPPAAEKKVEAPAESPAKPKAELRREKTEDKPKGKAAARKPRAERKPSGRRGTSLAWVPVKDHDYDGFAAPSAAGQFKVLITKGSQWALFYELKGTWPKQIGCFRKVDKAKERAQELHDAGWPESEFGPVTAGQVARACPMPQGKDDGEDEEATPTMKTPPKSEEKPAPPPAPQSASKAETEQDKELLGSFKTELDAVLDEDEDD